VFFNLYLHGKKTTKESDHGPPNLRCHRPVYVQGYAAPADALHLRHPTIAYRFTDNRHF
jgi:hypothetical protein